MSKGERLSTSVETLSIHLGADSGESNMLESGRPQASVSAVSHRPKSGRSRATSASSVVENFLSKFELLPEVPGARPPDVKGIINPFAPRMQIWDGIIMAAMAFTALVTPVEVAFTEQDPENDLQSAMFWINLLVTITFLIDMIIVFHTPFLDRESGIWVTDKKRIAWRYLKGWFIIDLVSVFPFELVGFFVTSENVSQLRVLRVVRLLRLTKLLRIIRASRIWARWSQQLPFSFAQLSLVGFFITVLLMSHWAACSLGIIASIEGADYNWEVGYFQDNLSLPPDSYSPYSVYLAAYYWAIMTLTTIGYGDVTAKTDGERLLVTLLMIIGGGMYAYVVGAVCGIVASMDMLKIEFRQTVDELNMFMKEKKIPKVLRAKLRRYVHYTEDQRRLRHYQKLVEDLSPALRGEVYRVINKDWVSKVYFLSLAAPTEEEDFITAIAVALEMRTYPPLEQVMEVGEEVENMFIINKGVVAVHLTPDIYDETEELVEYEHIHVNRTLSKPVKQALEQGNCFGHEIITSAHVSVYNVTTLTYCDFSILTKTALLSILSKEAFAGTRENIDAHVLEKEWDTVSFRRKMYANARAQSERAKELKGELVTLRQELAKAMKTIRDKERELEKETSER